MSFTDFIPVNVAATVIRVKPLDWRSDFDGYWFAEQYTISSYPGRGAAKFSGRFFCLRNGTFRIGPTNGFASLDEAKTAVQYHHERHVLSLIEVETAS